jgi:hypothetical protein
MDADDFESKVHQSGAELVELKGLVKLLQARVDRQACVITALKDMLLSIEGFSENDFLERVKKAAAQKADDKSCRKCGKVMNAKHKRCMYCGEERPPELL